MPILQMLGCAEIAVCLVVFSFLVVKGPWGDYWALGLYLVARALSNVVMLLLQHFAKRVGLMTAYRIYFYVYWPSFAVESILSILILYGIVRMTMAPLKGLQVAGRLVFSVAAVVSVGASLWLCFGPQMTATRTIVVATSQLQRTQSLLALCLLLFLTFALRPLGLSFRSRVYGVSLGLGIMATHDLVQSAWLRFHPNLGMVYSVINGMVFCTILSLWTVYFALPEPGRRVLVGESALGRLDRVCLDYYGEAI